MGQLKVTSFCLKKGDPIKRKQKVRFDNIKDLVTSLVSFA